MVTFHFSSKTHSDHDQDPPVCIQSVLSFKQQRQSKIKVKTNSGEKYLTPSCAPYLKCTTNICMLLSRRGRSMAPVLALLSSSRGYLEGLRRPAHLGQKCSIHDLPQPGHKCQTLNDRGLSICILDNHQQRGGLDVLVIASRDRQETKGKRGVIAQISSPASNQLM